MVADIKHGVDEIICAMHAGGAATKLRCNTSLLARMASVKMAMRTLAQCKVNFVPVVSNRQEAAFLDLINPICAQATAWRAKVEGQIINS